jgi:hypothetical protein
MNTASSWPQTIVPARGCGGRDCHRLRVVRLNGALHDAWDTQLPTHFVDDQRSRARHSANRQRREEEGQRAADQQADEDLR